MDINEIKSYLITAEKEYIINKKIVIKDKEAVILSYTVGNEINSVWMIYKNESESVDEKLSYDRKNKTNEEVKLLHIKSEKEDIIELSQIEIQDQVMILKLDKTLLIIELSTGFDFSIFVNNYVCIKLQGINLYDTGLC